MLRLRTTIALSLLAMAIGITGTDWLSGLTGGWPGPAARMAQTRVKPAHRLVTARPRHAVVSRPERHVPPQVMATQTASASELVPAGAASAAELVPIVMPALATPYDDVRDHLHGRVLLHLRIDGNGRVLDAVVDTSSGDPLLDAHAVATVRNWRFAVPADHPDGLSGELPMRFDTGGDPIASLP